jgi:DNA-directed RNA polymerase specialized sigma subunit
VDGFGAAWSRAFNASALAGRDLHLHDLRGTAATNYYRADFTIREIAGILGWSEDKVERLIDRYVKRDEILKDRIRRLEKAQK